MILNNFDFSLNKVFFGNVWIGFLFLGGGGRWLGVFLVVFFFAKGKDDDQIYIMS